MLYLQAHPEILGPWSDAETVSQVLTVAAYYQVDRLVQLVLKGVQQVLRTATPDTAVGLVCAVEQSLPDACMPDWGAEVLVLLRCGMLACHTPTPV